MQFSSPPSDSVSPSPATSPPQQQSDRALSPPASSPEPPQQNSPPPVAPPSAPSPELISSPPDTVNATPPLAPPSAPSRELILPPTVMAVAPSPESVVPISNAPPPLTSPPPIVPTPPPAPAADAPPLSPSPDSPPPAPSSNSPPPPATSPTPISPITPESAPPPPPTPVPFRSPPPPGSPSPPMPSPSPPNPTSPPPPSSNTPPVSPPPPPTRILSPPPFIVLTPPPPPPPLPLAPPPNQSNSGGGISTAATVAIAVAVNLFFLGIFGVIGCCVWNRSKKSSGTNGGYIIPTNVSPSPQSGSNVHKMQVSAPNNGSDSVNVAIYSPREHGGLRNSRIWFTYEDLVDATDGFSPHNLLGEGGFGSVYKGILADGRKVAVKQLKDGRGQGEREFRSEVEIIGRIHHRHLVSLVGYCISEERRLLVYDYLPNNTLYFHLHDEGTQVLDWNTRLKIAIGTARGIAYLHEDCDPRIIHRDIKSSNILLDENFEARVSDFGLAKLAMDANTHITTRVMGTFGYMAPEYVSSGKLTEKSDVYSFGVVILELISGRKSVDASQPLGEESLVEWARPLLSHALETEDFGELPDPRLEHKYIDHEMFRLIEVAAACVLHSAVKRPTMGQVVRAFDSMATTDLTNGMRVGESEAFNSAQQSAEIGLFRRMAFGSENYSTDFPSPNFQGTSTNTENSGKKLGTNAEKSRKLRD